MKAAHQKTLNTFAGLALVLPFVAVAAFVATKAVGKTGGSEQSLLLLGLALACAFVGFTSSRRTERAEEERELFALHITARERRGRRAFM